MALHNVRGDSVFEASAFTDEVVEQFATDGVVCLRQIVDPVWLDTLGRGMDRHLAAPTARSRVWDEDAEGRTCFYDSQAWMAVPEYRSFIEQSGIAEVAGRVMGVDAVNFFFDAVFVRTPGNQFRTPFHQDEPYWSVEGFDTCSIWMPLVPVARASALEFVRGSHRWNTDFAQTNFGALTNDARDQVVHDADERVPFPDIEGNRADYDIVGFAMAPGDIVIFNARTIHGGSGNLPPDQDLRVFNTKWIGDQVRVCFRPDGMDPDHSGIMTEHGLAHGDRLRGPLYPELWRRELV